IPALLGMSLVRADVFGVSARILLLELLIGTVMALCLTLAIAACCRRRSRKHYTIILSVYILTSMIITELWFGFDEMAFRYETSKSPTEVYSRNRWSPFSSHGLIYQNEEFYAYD